MNPTRFIDGATAYARGLAPEQISAATRLGEKALQEIFSRGVSAADKDAYAVVRQLHLEKFDFPGKRFAIVSPGNETDAVHASVRKFTESETSLITELDGLGIRAKRPEHVRVSSQLENDGRKNQRRFEGTEFHFLKRPDLKFKAAETSDRSAFISPHEFNDYFRASLLDGSRLVSRTVIARDSNPSDMVLTGRTPLSPLDVDILLHTPNTHELTIALLPNLEKDAVAAHLQVLSPGRSTEFHFTTELDSRPMALKRDHSNWMSPHIWIRETQARAAEPLTILDLKIAGWRTR